MKHSFAWWCYARKNTDAEQLLRSAKALGYEGVEMIDQQHWPLVTDLGLTIATIAGHESLTNGLNRREQHERIEREIHANLELAVRWHIPNLICFSGNRAGLDDERGAEITAEGLSRVAKAAEDAGVTLVLELLNSKVDHEDYQCDKTPWGVKVCQSVNSPRVKLLYDIYHMQIMEGDLIRTIRDYHAYFGHYHLAGNPGRHEPDVTQEINYPPILEAITATGYTGFMGHEYVPLRDPIESLQASLALYGTR